MRVKDNLSIQIFEILFLCFIIVFNGCDSNPLGVEPPKPAYPIIDDSPCWSPDGSTIVFYHLHITHIDSSGSYLVDWDSTGLWFINPDGTNKRMFLNLTEYSAGSPDWSPDMEWITFVKGARIWKIKVDGSSITQLTFGRRTFFPDWSPDGIKIIYAQTIDTETHPQGMWIMNADGSNDHIVMRKGGAPDWSPDGTKITFDGIYLADSNGTNVELIHQGGWYPAWSPDSSKIAFTSDEGISIMNVDGSNSRYLTLGYKPSWSPDGNQIVYTGWTKKHYNPMHNGVLYIINMDGTNKRQLTFGPN